MEEVKELITKPYYYDKSGRSKVVRISRDHPFYRTSNKGNISEPRLIMANHLGRNLTKDDIVYLKDGDKSNTSIDNLVVLTRREFATIRDLERLKKAVARTISMISVYEGYLKEAGIDPTTLNRTDSGSRYREVERDREAADRSRRRRREVEE